MFTLMDQGVGDAVFMDEAIGVGNEWATEEPRNADGGATPDISGIGVSSAEK
jgi:hypothetical protein